MNTKNWPYWVKGGIIGGFIGLFLPIIITNLVINGVALGEGFGGLRMAWNLFLELFPTLFHAGAISFLPAGFGVGALIGGIYGKIKNKNKVV